MHKQKYFLHFRLVFSLICISLSRKDHFYFIVLHLCCTCSIHLSHGLCNPRQRLVYCVKGNLVLLSFEYKKRNTVCSAKSVLLFASYASSILENTSNPGDISMLEKSEETSQSSTGSAKLCTWERTTSHITINWGTISRKAAWQKGPWGTWWLLC